MSYFKTSWAVGKDNNWGAAMQQILADTESVIYKHMTYENASYAQYGGFYLRNKDESLPVNFYYRADTPPFRSSISTGDMTYTGTVQYGEAEYKKCDTMTWFNITSSINRTAAHWTDSDDNAYIFHVYDNGTTHYASIATNNPDIAATNLSFTFPVVKDFDLRTAVNSLNGGSDRYIIQPLVAFGMKMPIFLITGANGADVPLFSEIEAQGKSYFVIGSNYCVEM